MAVHPWHEPQRRLNVPAPAPAPGVQLVADHRFSDDELDALLSALRARAESHPENPGLVACWPAVPAGRMAVACGLLARQGHPVQQVTVALWDGERTRDGWTLGPPPADVAATPDVAALVARSETGR